MADPLARAGKINGLQRAARIRRSRSLVLARDHFPWLAAGTAVYGIAIAFPILLRQVSAITYVAALVGTALLLIGLHLKWTAGTLAK